MDDIKPGPNRPKTSARAARVDRCEAGGSACSIVGLLERQHASVGRHVFDDRRPPTAATKPLDPWRALGGGCERSNKRLCSAALRAARELLAESTET